MFSFITGIPLNEYIRRRRLTLAGFELKGSDVKIIDLANKYGYDSPNSFTRAFQAMHGVTPSEARIPGVELKSFARISFYITIKGDVGMNYRIVKEGSLTVFGKSLTTKGSDAYETVPAFWDKCEENRTTNKIVEAGHGNEKTLLKAVISDMDNGMVSYMICLDMPEDGVSDEFETAIIPARTWAVFPLVIEKPGEDSIISIWKRIFPEWFPNSGYELDTGPRQELCYWRDDGKMVVEAWVPVVKIAHIH
jgi:AraC family transcriptional regulator